MAGSLLVASPRLLDPNFFRTVVLVVEHNDDGALGIVLNRPTDEPVAAHLPNWASEESAEEVIYVGGPVQTDVAIALGQTELGEPTGLNGLSMVDVSYPLLASGTRVRIYAGYSGWSAGQLEAELATGSWYLVAAHPDDPFAEGDLWTQVLRRQRGPLSIVSTFPDDPSLN